MPDPKLQQAMSEIRRVLERHDIAGVILLASPTHTEFGLALSPSWSCIRLNGNECRFRALGKDFPNKEAHKKCVEDSVGTVLGFMRTLQHTHEQLEKVAMMVGKHMEISHRDVDEGGPKARFKMEDEE